MIPPKRMLTKISRSPKTGTEKSNVKGTTRKYVTTGNAQRTHKTNKRTGTIDTGWSICKLAKLPRTTRSVVLHVTVSQFWFVRCPNDNHDKERTSAPGGTTETTSCFDHLCSQQLIQ